MKRLTFSSIPGVKVVVDQQEVDSIASQDYAAHITFPNGILWVARNERPLERLEGTGYYTGKFADGTSIVDRFDLEMDGSLTGLDVRVDGPGYWPDLKKVPMEEIRRVFGLK